MKYVAQAMAGNAGQSGPEGLRIAAALTCVALLSSLCASNAVFADQPLYKYRGDNGEWIYADRPPDDGSETELRVLEAAGSDGQVSVTSGFEGQSLVLTARNGFYAPVEIMLEIRTIRGIQFPDPDDDLRWVIPAKGQLRILDLPLLEDGSAPLLEYGVRYLAGDPAASHRPPGPYRVPFAVATAHPVTQAFPEVATHTTRDSFYAVDMAMPIGTDIFAARAGVVFDVASTNFTGGLDPVRDGPNANVIRILHDDGTYAIYAHLNTNSIRVRPGDVVRRGDYIADSGNTGFTSGPHLHFVVVRNAGETIESVPVTFLGPNSSTVVAASGEELTAY